MKSLVQWSYGLMPFQVSGGPSWFASDRFDIEAKPEAPASHQEALQMLQMLLAERFKVAVHHEKKEMTVYALVVAKSGPKLREVIGDDADVRSTLKTGDGHITATKQPMAALERVLGESLESVVVDRTGLTGKYDFVVDWTPEQGSSGPSLFAALQEQLGLKLEATRSSIDILVVDHADKAPTGN